MAESDSLEPFVVRMTLRPERPEAGEAVQAVFDHMGPDVKAEAIVTDGRGGVVIRIAAVSAKDLHLTTVGINRVLFEIYHICKDARLFGTVVEEITILDPYVPEGAFGWPGGSPQRFLPDALNWFLDHSDQLRRFVSELQSENLRLMAGRDLLPPVQSDYPD